MSVFSHTCMLLTETMACCSTVMEAKPNRTTTSELALVLVVTRVRSSTLAHLFPDLNPISLFGTILHAPPPTSFTAFLALIKCCKLYIGETGRRLSDRFAEHLRSIRNNDVDKPVARHFNAANHSISEFKSLSYFTHFWW